MSGQQTDIHSIPGASSLSVLDNMLEGCQIISRDWRYLYVNNVVAKHGRRAKQELLGKTMMECYPGIDQTPMFAMLRRCMEQGIPHQMDNEFTFPDGSKGWFELRMEPVPEGVFILSLDITERRQAEEHAQWLMRHDPVTKLPNKWVLFERIEGELEHLKENGSPGTLILISLENAMEIEATFGVSSMDEIVHQLSLRARSTAGNDTSAYVLSTNQVGILIPGKAGGRIQKTLENVAHALCKPFVFHEFFLHVDIRMGYVKLSREDKPPRLYLQEAHAALVEAKEKSRDRMAFNRQINSTIRQNMELLGELANALERNQLELHYQPKINLLDGTVAGVEALIRWKHKKLGYVPPDNFIPRAEKSTLIDSLTEWVMDNALKQLAQWRRLGLDISMAVNISARNLQNPGFVDLVHRLLEKWELSGERLELELTENALMHDVSRSALELGKLTGSNIVISIDDFGTGYSSLQYLNELPASIIKIDKSFVTELPANRGKAHIVEASIKLCHKLGFKIVAEGVETRDALDFLKGKGCHMAQGFWINHPVPASDFMEWHRAGDGKFFTGAA